MGVERITAFLFQHFHRPKFTPSVKPCIPFAHSFCHVLPRELFDVNLNLTSQVLFDLIAGQQGS
ncbi:MAG: hypothetical protein JWP08_3077 [Bryobacterales bacterium]|jgi:hypothetical protein|nr:hypothetical protein [Bryobacterales bacterium]